MRALRAQQRDSALVVSWMPPGNSAGFEELIAGYSVRWCPPASASSSDSSNSSSSSSSSKCMSSDVSRDVRSFEIVGLEAGATYNVSVKVRTRFANENWSSTLAPVGTPGAQVTRRASGMTPRRDELR